MPTTRPRHVITESDDVARALDEADRRWPEEGGNRRRLLLRLVAEGDRVAHEQSDQRLAVRRAAIERSSGALTGLYEPGYLDELRKDWPQ